MWLQVGDSHPRPRQRPGGLRIAHPPVAGPALPALRPALLAGDNVGDVLAATRVGGGRPAQLHRGPQPHGCDTPWGRGGTWAGGTESAEWGERGGGHAVPQFPHPAALQRPQQKRHLRVQGSLGGSAGARKKPSWQGQEAAAAAGGTVLGGQGWQSLGDTPALKEPGGQAVVGRGGGHTVTSVRPQNLLPHPQHPHRSGAGGASPPPSTQSGEFGVFCLSLQLIDKE